MASWPARTKALRTTPLNSHATRTRIILAWPNTQTARTPGRLLPLAALLEWSAGRTLAQIASNPCDRASGARRRAIGCAGRGGSWLAACLRANAPDLRAFLSISLVLGNALAPHLFGCFRYLRIGEATRIVACATNTAAHGYRWLQAARANRVGCHGHQYRRRRVFVNT